MSTNPISVPFIDRFRLIDISNLRPLDQLWALPPRQSEHSGYTGRCDPCCDLCRPRQCREEGVVKTGLLPEPQTPAISRPLSAQSGTTRCVEMLVLPASPSFAGACQIHVLLQAASHDLVSYSDCIT